MKQITFGEFEKFVEADPAWASHLTEDVEVTGFCDLYNSKISHLSKHLYFTEGDEDECFIARFEGCMQLKVATGNFSGSVDFGGSGIQKIKDLKIKADEGYAATFEYCSDLKTAAGSFSGFVNFNHSGVRAIKRLSVSEADSIGRAASFVGCEDLEIATGTYQGSVDFSSSGIKEIKRLGIAGNKEGGFAAKFCHCKNLKVATGIYCGHVSFLGSGIDSISDLVITNGGASFENCKELKIATGRYEGFVDFSESGIKTIKDLHIELPKRKKKADFRGCEKLKVDSALYPDYVFRGKSDRRKREDKINTLLKKLQAPRKKWLQRLRKLGFTRVFHRFSEGGDDSSEYFKGEIIEKLEIKNPEFNGFELSYELEMFFLEYTKALYYGWTSCSGACGSISWDLDGDKMTISHCWGEENEDYYENWSEVVV